MIPPAPAAIVAQSTYQNVAPVRNPPAPATPTLAGLDRTFALAALQANHAEIATAQFALERSSVAEVRGSAEKMISEHTALGSAMQPAILHALGTSSPPQQLSAGDTLTYRHLQTVPEADFDQEYLQAQIAGHLAALADFRAEADNGTDARVKALAQHWLPTIQSHIVMCALMLRRAA